MTSINYNEFQAGQGVSAPALNQNFTLTNNAIDALTISLNSSVTDLTSISNSKANKNGSSSENFSVNTATSDSHAVNLEQLKTFSPIGMVIFYAGNLVPSGFLLCDGRAVSRETYSNLFQVISTTYGSGDGTSTFNLPLLTDNRFIRGSASVGSYQSSSLQSHSHSVTYSGASGIQAQILNGEDTFSYYATSASMSATTSAFGGSDTYPKNLSLLPCIKY